MRSPAPSPSRRRAPAMLLPPVTFASADGLALYPAQPSLQDHDRRAHRRAVGDAHRPGDLHAATARRLRSARDRDRAGGTPAANGSNAPASTLSRWRLPTIRRRGQSPPLASSKPPVGIGARFSTVSGPLAHSCHGHCRRSLRRAGRSRARRGSWPPAIASVARPGSDRRPMHLRVCAPPPARAMQATFTLRCSTGSRAVLCLDRLRWSRP